MRVGKWLGAAVVGALVTGAGIAADSETMVKVAYKDGMVKQSLTGKPGDAVEGRKVFANRKLGNCLACHENSDLSEELFHGNVGPSLNGVASRWEEGDLRAIVINAKTVFGDATIMPSFYRLENGIRPMKNFEGKPILTAAQVEDVIAYIVTLKDE